MTTADWRGPLYRIARGRPDRNGPRLAGTERTLVAEYLRSGTVVTSAFGTSPDPFGGPKPVPIGTLTDGYWIWQAELGFLVETYGLAPEPELLEHIRDQDYLPPRLTNDDRIRIGRWLLASV